MKMIPQILMLVLLLGYVAVALLRNGSTTRTHTFKAWPVILGVSFELLLLGLGGFFNVFAR